MPKRRALLRLGLMRALYPASYLVVSRDGFYDAGPLGFGQRAGNTTILVSKFGYEWHRFEGVCGLGNFESAPIPTMFNALYLPLLEEDRQWWHTGKKAESGKYPVKGDLIYEWVDCFDGFSTRRLSCCRLTKDGRCKFSCTG